MRIIPSIEARQDDVIRKILDHCGLWQEPRPAPFLRRALATRTTSAEVAVLIVPPPARGLA